MKSKMRKGRSTGGVNEAEEDLKMKTPDRVNAKKIDEEADERKAGGRAKKAGGKVEGMKKHHMGRKARRSGGGVEANPFSAARKGTPPKGHSVEMDGE